MTANNDHAADIRRDLAAAVDSSPELRRMLAALARDVKLPTTRRGWWWRRHVVIPLMLARYDLRLRLGLCRPYRSAQTGGLVDG